MGGNGPGETGQDKPVFPNVPFRPPFYMYDSQVILITEFLGFHANIYPQIENSDNYYVYSSHVYEIEFRH